MKPSRYVSHSSFDITEESCFLVQNTQLEHRLNAQLVHTATATGPGAEVLKSYGWVSRAPTLRHLLQSHPLPSLCSPPLASDSDL